jgi:serine/threonine protein kinase
LKKAVASWHNSFVWKEILPRRSNSLMTTECNQFVFGFHPQKRREIRAQFDGGTITSDGGGLLLPTVVTEEFVTTPGTAMGTIAYMSPEQARGEELDARTDLFSFGAVLYEMSTGRMAFPGNSAAVIHDAILNRTPTPLARVNPDLPPELERIINKALEKVRKLRNQSAAEIRTDLQRLKRDTESARLPATTNAGTTASFGKLLGCFVTLTCRIRRRSWLMTKKQ